MAWQQLTHTELAHYSEILWQRPEQQARRGSILIVCADQTQLVEANTQYELIKATKPKRVCLLLPASAEKLVPPNPDIQFLPATKSSSFAAAAHEALLQHILTADTVLIAGTVGKNAETIALFKEVLPRCTVPVITRELDYALRSQKPLLHMQGTAKTSLLELFDQHQLLTVLSENDDITLIADTSSQFISSYALKAKDVALAYALISEEVPARAAICAVIAESVEL